MVIAKKNEDTLPCRSQKLSVYLPRWPQDLTYIPAGTRHWLSFLRSAQACDLSITDAISELLGVGHKKPPSPSAWCLGDIHATQRHAVEEPKLGGRPQAGTLADSPS